MIQEFFPKEKKTWWNIKAISILRYERIEEVILVKAFWEKEKKKKNLDDEPKWVKRYIKIKTNNIIINLSKLESQEIFKYYKSWWCKNNSINLKSGK